MRLKNYLLSGLCVVALAACTNDDFMEQDTSVAKLPKDVVSLGTGYTIEVGRSETAETRFALSADYSTSTWSMGDTVGGAWIAYKKAGSLQPFANTATSKAMTTMSNHPFKVTSLSADSKRAFFTAPTQVFEGYHILYYPYNANVKSVQSNGVTVSVEQNQTMDCTEGNEGKHINDAFFEYALVSLEGGPEMNKTFDLKPAVNLWKLNIGMENDELYNDVVGARIESILIEATTSDGSAVFASDATFEGVTNNMTDNYNGYEVKLNPSYTSNAMLLTVENNDDMEDYQVTATGGQGIAKNSFYLVSLPMNTDKVSSLSVKVLFNKRGLAQMFSKSWKAGDSTLNNILTAAKTAGGKLVTVEAQMTERTNANAIYTLAKLEEAIAKPESNNIELGVDITLPDGYVYKTASTITKTISGSKLKAAGSFDMQSGKLEINSTLDVAGDLIVTGGSLIQGDKGAISATNITATGGTLVMGNKNASVEEVNVTGGTVYLSAAKIGAVKITTGGLTLDQNVEIGSLNITGKYATLESKANISLTGNSTIDGNIVIATGDTITNYGILTMNNGTAFGESGKGGIKNLRSVVLNGASSTIGLENYGTVKIQGEPAIKSDPLTVNGIRCRDKQKIDNVEYGPGNVEVELATKDTKLTLVDSLETDSMAIDIKKGIVTLTTLKPYYTKDNSNNVQAGALVTLPSTAANASVVLAGNATESRGDSLKVICYSPKQVSFANGTSPATWKRNIMCHITSRNSALEYTGWTLATDHKSAKYDRKNYKAGNDSIDTWIIDFPIYGGVTTDSLNNDSIGHHVIDTLFAYKNIIANKDIKLAKAVTKLKGYLDVANKITIGVNCGKNVERDNEITLTLQDYSINRWTGAVTLDGGSSTYNKTTGTPPERFKLNATTSATVIGTGSTKNGATAAQNIKFQLASE